MKVIKGPFIECPFSCKTFKLTRRICKFKSTHVIVISYSWKLLIEKSMLKIWAQNLEFVDCKDLLSIKTLY